MPCLVPIKATGTQWRALYYLQHVSVQPELYNWQRTFRLEWQTDNPRYQSAVSQEHDARCQPILRLPRHDAKYFTYATWAFYRWVNWSLTYHRIQDNATGYGKMPIIGSTRVQSWTPAGRATAQYQAFNLQNVKIAPMNEFLTHHLDQSRQDDARRQSQWLPVMHANQPYPGKLHQAVTKAAYEMQRVHKVENHSWIDQSKSYSFIYPPIPWPGELSANENLYLEQ